MLAGLTDVQHHLMSQTLEYLDTLSQQTTNDPDVELDLIKTYTKINNVLGNPYERNLGDGPKAILSLEKAIRLADNIAQRTPTDHIAARRIGVARRSLGEVYF